jgi:hypothetical protein
MENKFDTLNSLIGRVFEKGIFDDTEEYREEFLNTLTDKIIKAIRANEFRFYTSKPIVDPGRISAHVCDTIEITFRMKSFNFPVYSAKEFVEDPYMHIADNGLNLVEYLEEELTEALDCDKVSVWIDVRSEGKKKRDIKVVMFKRRMVPVPEETTEPAKVEDDKPLPVKVEEKVIDDIAAKELTYDKATTEKMLLSVDEVAAKRHETVEEIMADDTSSIKDNTMKDCLIYSEEIHNHLSTRISVGFLPLADTTLAYIHVPTISEPIALVGITHMAEHIWHIEAVIGDSDDIPAPEAKGADIIDDILVAEKEKTFRYGTMHSMIVDYKTLERLSSIPNNMITFCLTRALKSGNVIRLNYVMTNDIIYHDYDNDRIVIKTVVSFN